jgi:endonuclease YncB( thermonuclease family)
MGLLLRIVAEVWIRPKSIDDKVDLSGVMLVKGAAYAFMLDDAIPNRPDLGGDYASAEAVARKARVGLWRGWLGDR